MRTSEVAGSEGPSVLKSQDRICSRDRPCPLSSGRCSLSVAMETGPCSPPISSPTALIPSLNPGNPCGSPGTPQAAPEQPTRASQQRGLRERGRAEGSLPEWARREGGAGGWVRWGGAAARGTRGSDTRDPRGDEGSRGGRLARVLRLRRPALARSLPLEATNPTRALSRGE